MGLEFYLDPDIVPLTVWPVARIRDQSLIGCTEDHDSYVATFKWKLQLHIELATAILAMR